MRRGLPLVVAALLLGLLPGPATAAAGPDGYARLPSTTLAPGLERQVYLGRGVARVVNVARIAPDAKVELRTVSAHDAVGGTDPRLERTSSMCARARCLVAVNGDFFREEVAVGAVVSHGELFRSPNAKHHQLKLADDGPSAGALSWSAKLVSSDLQELGIDGVNVARAADRLVLYTPRFGDTTLTNPFGAEMVIRFRSARDPLPLGQTAVARLEQLRFGKGDTPIPPDGAVLSGHGRAAEALRALWARVRSKVAGEEALVRVDAKGSVREAIGGTPILLRDGRRWFTNHDNLFVRERHPRTIVGWNPQGAVWLVTVDGRQTGYSTGFSLSEAATFMQDLGATDAINLDGGGSTTFVVDGDVVNRPSDRLVGGPGGPIIVNQTSNTSAPNVERPVVNALAVVPVEEGATATPSPRLGLRLPRGRPVAAGASRTPDPGSVPGAELPAIVGMPPAPGRAVPVSVALAMNAAVLVAVLGPARRRYRKRAR